MSAKYAEIYSEVWQISYHIKGFIVKRNSILLYMGILSV